MLTNIKQILTEIDGMSGWKVTEGTTSSKELFFVKDKLDMNRGKDVKYYEITVYKAFEENGKKYMGSSSVKVADNMMIDEIKERIENALYAASFVKNEYYPLVKKSDKTFPILQSSLEGDALAHAEKLVKAAYKHNGIEECHVNSLELFINEKTNRLVTSEGIDYTFKGYGGEIEVITDCSLGEPVEIFNDILFADLCETQIEDEIKEQLIKTRERSEAEQVKLMEDVDVIISGGDLAAFFDFYVDQANAQLVYEKISKAAIGENIQGEAIKGDKINIVLDPFMPNSTASRPFDADGVVLEPIRIYEDGVVKTFHGSNRFASYLGIEATGSIGNVSVLGGQYKESELKAKPHVELVTFSDFQMDTLTGDFGGEFRLGRYFDGEKTTPITGGSIMGNIFKMQKELYFSQEVEQHNNFKGPKVVLFKHMTVSGQVE